MKKKIFCGMLAVSLMCSPISVFAKESNGTDFPITYTTQDGNYLFEKVSHKNSGTETKDGIVDYINGSKQIMENTSQTSENGDSVQSYTYCAATSGDWVYMGTMYGALSAYSQVERAVSSFGASADVAKAVVDVMFNGKLNKGKEDDGYSAGSVFLKFNIKTGETKILMSRTLYDDGKCDGVPIFRAATNYNGKLYFVGLVSDGKALAGQKMYGMDIPNDPNIAINYEISYQTGVPCVYELDPKTDKLVKVAQCVTTDGYRALNNQYVFTSTRAIDTFVATKADGSKEEWLLAGGLADTTQGETFGATIMAAKEPETVNSNFNETNLDVLHGSFKTIANQQDMFNYPAVNRQDSEGGGGLYQVVQYGENTIYASIVTGKAKDKTKEQGFAVVKGVYNPNAGDVSDANAWTWTPVIGNKADGAKYTFGVDPERTAASACTLQVYGDYLYIGDYNDVNYSLTNILTERSFRVLAKNLSQSINLYRMDHNENIEMVVGDPTEMFPQSITGIGSGYESHMNQYTWMTNVVGDTMYLSTMDETSLTHCIAQLVNGELLNMSQEEWESQLNYILVLAKLMFASNGTNTVSTYAQDSMTEEDANSLIESAVKELNEESPVATTGLNSKSKSKAYTAVSLTDEQKAKLVNAILDGSINVELPDEIVNQLEEINTQLRELRELLNQKVSEDFVDLYDRIHEKLEELLKNSNLPEEIKAMYEMLISFTTSENLGYLKTCLGYMKDSEAGFDFYAIKQDESGNVKVTTLTTNGFGDRYNHGLRIITETPGYMVIGTANPFNGAQVWRTKVDNIKSDDSDSKTDESDSKTDGSDSKPSDSNSKTDSTTGSDSNSKSNVEATVSTDSKKENSKNPTTGDDTNVMIFGTMLVAAAAFFITIKKLKKD